MKDHDAVEALNRLLKARLGEWQLREKSKEQRPKPVVTVTREPGCGAEAIVQKLASELGLHLYDWELVERIAKDEEMSAELVAALEKNPPSEFKQWLDELHGKSGLSSDAYYGTLKHVLFAIVAPGNALIVGRGSNFLLPPDMRIGLCFVAPRALRIFNTMKELGLTKENAAKHIASVEARHRKLVKRYFQADIRDPTHYHLVINTALVKPQPIVRLVEEMMKKSDQAA
jgi:cytidylate kinase